MFPTHPANDSSKCHQFFSFGLNNILFNKSQDMLWKYIVEIGSDIKLWGLLWSFPKFVSFDVWVMFLFCVLSFIHWILHFRMRKLRLLCLSKLVKIVLHKNTRILTSHLRGRCGTVVECLTPPRGAAGSSLTGVTALWSLSKTHLS